MNQQNTIGIFLDSHNQVIAYVDSLSETDFLYSNKGKWTAGQQLNHILLSLAPVVKLLENKQYILERFGRIDRKIMDYDTLVVHYQAILQKGAKAPERFVPPAISYQSKQEQLKELEALLVNARLRWEDYTEADRNSLVIPHPVLGNLTIREMICFLTYHALHHLRYTQENVALGNTLSPLK